MGRHNKEGLKSMSFKFMPEDGSFELGSQILSVIGWNVSLEVDGCSRSIGKSVMNDGDGRLLCRH